jgi:hypothetical protein
VSATRRFREPPAEGRSSPGSDCSYDLCTERLRRSSAPRDVQASSLDRIVHRGKQPKHPIEGLTRSSSVVRQDGDRRCLANPGCFRELDLVGHVSKAAPSARLVAKLPSASGLPSGLATLAAVSPVSLVVGGVAGARLRFAGRLCVMAVVSPRLQPGHVRAPRRARAPATGSSQLTCWVILLSDRA